MEKLPFIFRSSLTSVKGYTLTDPLSIQRALPQALWKSYAKAMEKLFKTLVSLDFTTTQQFTTGRDAPPLHPFFLSFF